MGRFENLLIEYDDELLIKEWLPKNGLRGYYSDGIVLLDRTLNTKYKLETLTEEIAHHKITYGDIRNQKVLMNRKYELKARRLGCELAVSLDDIVEAFQYGVQNLYETAEFLEVSEKYVLKVIEHYKMKHGLSTYHKGYVIKFEPLQVFRHIEF